MSQAKVFTIGAVLGAAIGATVLASIAHILLVGLALVGIGALVHRARQLILHRDERKEQLKTETPPAPRLPGT